MDRDRTPECRSRPGPNVRIWGLVVAALIAIVAVAAPGLATSSSDTVGDAVSGRATFASNCAVCHGRTAQGRGTAPRLTDVLERHSVAEVQETIREGRDGMPSFEGALDPQEIDDVTAYLTELSDEPGSTGRGPQMHRWWDDMMWDGSFGGSMLAWLLLGLVVIALIVLALAWIARSAGSPDRRAQPPQTGATSAREELDRRYARGELSREEYRQIRDDLDEPGS